MDLEKGWPQEIRVSDVGPGAKPAQHRDTRGELGKF